MRIQTLILWSCFLLMPLFGIAQKVTEYAQVSWSDPLKRTVVNAVAGTDETGTYIVSNRTGITYARKFKLSHLDDNGNVTRSVNFDMSKLDKRLFMVEVLLFQGKLVMLCTSRNTETNQRTFFIRQLNRETFEFEAFQKELLTYTYDKKSSSGTVTWFPSRDQQSIVLKCKAPEIKKRPNKFSYIVLDKELNVMWDREVDFGLKAPTIFDPEFVRVDASGNLYLSGPCFKEVPEKYYRDLGDSWLKGRVPNFDYRIYTITNEGKRVQEYRVDLGGKYITDLQFKKTPGGTIVCGGFYSDRQSNSILGSFFLSINVRTKKIKAKYKDFDQAFIKDGWSNRELRRANRKEKRGEDAALVSYYLDDIVLQDDDGALLIAEEYRTWRTTSTVTNGNGAQTIQTNYHYRYGDILVIKADADGQVLWNKKVHKNQYSVNDGGRYSSYLLQTKGDRLHFIFNDHPANFQATQSNQRQEVFSNPRASILTIATIDGNEPVKYEGLLTEQHQRKFILPGRSKRVQDKGILLYGQQRSKQFFGWVKFVE